MGSVLLGIVNFNEFGKILQHIFAKLTHSIEISLEILKSNLCCSTETGITYPSSAAASFHACM